VVLGTSTNEWQGMKKINKFICPYSRESISNENKLCFFEKEKKVWWQPEEK
jgi:hypothetical protein